MPPKSAPKRRLDEVDYEDSEQLVKKPRRAISKSKKKDAGACSLMKKEIGDNVKHALRLDKYHLSKMHFDMTMDLAFFRSFFVDNGSITKPLSITPSELNETSPIIVVEMNNAQAGELLGVSKVKGGNRMATTHLRRLGVAFRP